VVDETEKGWFIAYISRDPESIRRMQAATKKEKMAKDDDERQAESIRGQVERGRKSGPVDTRAAPTELTRGDADEKVALKLVTTTAASSSTLSKTSVGRAPSLLTNVLRVESEKAAERRRKEDNQSIASSSASSKSASGAKRKSALEEIMEAEAAANAKRLKMVNIVIFLLKMV